MKNFIYLILVFCLLAGLNIKAAELNIVTWNVKGQFLEYIEKNRVSDFAAFDKALKPDILVLTEVAGESEAKFIAKSLGWQKYYGAVSNLGTVRDAVYQGLEFAVISKIPISSVTEYDVTPDGVINIFSNDKSYIPKPVTEQKPNTDGVPFIQQTGGRDRVTLRVDLNNNMTILPVHLKSNRNYHCADVGTAYKYLEKNKIEIPDLLRTRYHNGFEAATNKHLKNAEERERTIAAVALIGDLIIKDGRIVLIAGDFNTGYEIAKAGDRLDYDCKLENFTCEKGPFLKGACKGDGFDDTLSILENGLKRADGTRTSKWQVLSKKLESTYDDEAYANVAIDHIAVPSKIASEFTNAKAYNDFFGSDHKPVFTTFKQK